MRNDGTSLNSPISHVHAFKKINVTAQSQECMTILETRLQFFVKKKKNIAL